MLMVWDNLSISCVSWFSDYPCLFNKFHNCYLFLEFILQWRNEFPSEQSLGVAVGPDSLQEGLCWNGIEQCSFFSPVLSSKLSQKTLHVHSCSYEAPQDIKCMPSAICHEKRTLVNSRDQLKHSSQHEWKSITKYCENITTMIADALSSVEFNY